jgi:acetate CoA/acetoacetate CoA-transferase beta subunit
MREARRYIAARVAKELHDGDVVNLGIGLPTMVPSFLPEGVSVVLQSENGIVDLKAPASDREADPLHITDAGGRPAVAGLGGAYLDSVASFGLIRGGHVDCTILGALEVDAEGNLANWIIPGGKVAGMGGAMDLVVGARRVIVAMEHTVRGAAKILARCRLPLTGVRCVTDIVTEMAVMKVTPAGLVLVEHNPEFSLEEILAATEADLIVPAQMPSPTGAGGFPTRVPSSQ